MANIVRQRGECEAVAIEFRDAKMSQLCMDTLRFVVQTSNDTQAAASARRSEPDMRACTL